MVQVLYAISKLKRIHSYQFYISQFSQFIIINYYIFNKNNFSCMLNDFNYRASLLHPCEKIFLANKIHLNKKIGKWRRQILRFNIVRRAYTVCYINILYMSESTRWLTHMSYYSFNSYSAGIDFRSQILTSKVDTRAVRVNIFEIVLDP